jgi:hypothetical protein
LRELLETVEAKAPRIPIPNFKEIGGPIAGMIHPISNPRKSKNYDKKKD